MRFVPTKSVDQLDLQALHRVRSRLVSQRTAIVNQIRAFLLERGIAVRQGLSFLRHALPDILANRADVLTPRMVNMIEDLAGDLHHLDERIDEVTGATSWSRGFSRSMFIGASAADWRMPGREERPFSGCASLWRMADGTSLQHLPACRPQCPRRTGLKPRSTLRKNASSFLLKLDPFVPPSCPRLTGHINKAP
jgi:hypothetical protein